MAWPNTRMQRTRLRSPLMRLPVRRCAQVLRRASPAPVEAALQCPTASCRSALSSQHPRAQPARPAAVALPGRAAYASSRRLHRFSVPAPPSPSASRARRRIRGRRGVRDLERNRCA